MRKFLALFIGFSLFLFASIAFATKPAAVIKKTGTENAMMKGEGKKLGLKKNAVKKAAKKGMKKNAVKKAAKKGMKKKTEATSPAPTTGTGTTALPGSGTPVETPVSSPVQTVSVNIQNFAFTASTVNVKVGDTVKWTNLDSTGHTVESNDGTTFKSSTLVINDTFSKTFSAAGTFAYHCGPHPSMTGTVVVTQ